MAEQWEKGDPVWRWLTAAPSGDAGAWMAGVIKECDWMAEEARVCVVLIYGGVADPSGFWVALADLRPRDPALGGKDKPKGAPDG